MQSAGYSGLKRKRSTNAEDSKELQHQPQQISNNLNNNDHLDLENNININNIIINDHGESSNKNSLHFVNKLSTVRIIYCYNHISC